MAVSKWDDKYYVRSYLYAKSGMNDTAVARALGVMKETFDRWKKGRPAFAEALAEGRKTRNEEGSIREFIYKRLSPDMKEVWDRINLCESSPSGVVRAEQMLSGLGTTFRQHLFLYALVDANFNASEACRKVNVSVQTYTRWIATDPDFAKLVEEIHWHKGNFFETALVDAVAAGEPTAILFANKTFNRDRGYGESVKVDINKTVKIEHTQKHEITLNLATLPLEKKKRILSILQEPVIEVQALPFKGGITDEIQGGERADDGGTPVEGQVG